MNTYLLVFSVKIHSQWVCRHENILKQAKSRFSRFLVWPAGLLFFSRCAAIQRIHTRCEYYSHTVHSSGTWVRYYPKDTRETVSKRPPLPGPPCGKIDEGDLLRESVSSSIK